MRLVGGVDPGLDGALCFADLAGQRLIELLGMPTLALSKGKGTKREIDVHGLLLALRSMSGHAIERVFIERVSPRPGEGTVSSFKFGRGVGQIEALVIALGWPIEYVSPRSWKKALGLPVGATKDDSLHRASLLLPQGVAHWTPKRLVMNQAQCYGRAEATLICLYGARVLAGTSHKAAA